MTRFGACRELASPFLCDKAVLPREKLERTFDLAGLKKIMYYMLHEKDNQYF